MKFQWETFKQSNVARIFIAYAVVAFGLMQVFDYLLPIIEAPLWVAQTLTLLLFLGFPISLLIGWVTQRPILSADTALIEKDSGFAQGLSRQKLILIGLGSSALFGFLGLILMPYLLDQASFARVIQESNNSALSQMQNYKAFRASINLGPTGVRQVHNTRTDIAVSDDGMSLAFLRHDDSQYSDLYIKDLTDPNAERLMGQIDGVGGSGLMFFSEDNNWLHFVSGGNLLRVRVEGGAFQTVSSENVVLRSGYTTFDSEVIFSNAADNKLYRIPGSGGEATPLPLADAENSSLVFTWPRRLPGSNSILVTTSESPNDVGIGSIQLYNNETGEMRSIIETASNATYSNSGHVLFVRDNALWAVPFDISNMEIVGLEVPMIQGIETNSQYGHATYAISDDGRLFYLAGEDGASTALSTQLSWISRDGQRQSLITDGRQYGHPTLSPDDELISVTVYEPSGASDIWVWDLSRNTLGRRTFDGRASRSIWSPDGERLIYSSSNEILSVAANGTEPPVSIMTTASLAKTTSMSPSGDIIFDMGGPLAIYSIFSGTESSAETLATELELSPTYNPNPIAQVSPDGNWITYSSNETGSPQIYVRPYPDLVGGKWQVSIEPGFQPLWSSEGDELFYWGMNNRQYVVPYNIGEEQISGRPNLIEFGVPEEMFSIVGLRNFQTVPSWAYSERRGAFVLLEREGGSALSDAVSSLTNLVYVENWFEELRALAPALVN